MSKIDELIQKHCPNGVEFKKIKDVFTRLRGTPITAGKMKEIEKTAGEIRIFAGGKTVINAFEKDIPNANIIRKPAVLVQSRGVIDAIYYEEPFTFKNEMWAYTADNKVAVKYLYYVLKNNLPHFRDAASGMGSLPQISLPVTEDFSIPVPPLEVQRRIVKILDNFTELTAERTAELTAELKARQKQYTYYRDQLLTFGDKTKTFVSHELIQKHCPNGVEYKKLGEICDIPRGRRLVRNDLEEFGDYAVYQNSMRPLGYYHESNVKADTTFIISAGAAGEIGYSNVDFWAADDVYFLLVPNSLKSKFIYYVLLTQQAKILCQVRRASIPRLSKNVISKIMIPVPPLAEQERIVAILDKFDALTNSITEGLPREIELRQNQYEYYRDKLLTFPQKEVEA